MNTKYCYKCKNNKPINAFYRDITRGDGHAGICKNCERLRNREKRERNNHNYINKDKRYYQQHREEILARRKSYNQKNKKKSSVRSKAGYAINRGMIKKESCEICRSVFSVAHHDDYNKPLDVRWLCQKHHLRWHAENKAIE